MARVRARAHGERRARERIPIGRGYHERRSPAHPEAAPRADIQVVAQEGCVPEAHVVSVSGPRPVGVLGVVDAHDHLFIDSPAMPAAFDDRARAIAEALDGRETGIDHRRDDADRSRPAPTACARSPTPPA
jgi:hypothetical protein